MKKNVSKFLATLIVGTSVFSSGVVHGRPWTMYEDSILLDCVTELGQDWVNVCEKLFWSFGLIRWPDECEERYRLSLVSGFKKEWSEDELASLYRKVLTGQWSWEELAKAFNVPALVVKRKYYETCKKYDETMKNMSKDKECIFLSKELWVNDENVAIKTNN